MKLSYIIPEVTIFVMESTETILSLSDGVLGNSVGFTGTGYEGGFDKSNAMDEDNIPWYRK